MFSPRHAILLLFTLTCGCTAVKEARKAQRGDSLLFGESTVTARQAGLDSAATHKLSELEALALRYHPSILQARQATESARLQCRLTRAGRLPQITASGGYSRSTQNTSSQRSSEKMSGSWSGGIGLDLLLHDFGKLKAQELQQRENLIAAEEHLRDTELEVLYNLRNAFYERHRAANLLRVALHSEAQYTQHLEEARVMAEVGTRRQYDVTKAGVDLGNARLDTIAASNSLTVSHAQLNRALGMAENPPYEIEPETSYAPTKIPNPATLMADARENAPALAVLRAHERAASAFVDQSIADLYPDLSLGANFDLSGRGFPLVWNFSWAIRAAQSVFDGHRRTTLISEAVTRLRTARANLASAEQSLFLDLLTARAQLETALKRSEVARLVQSQSSENLDVVNEQYRVGISSSIERTDAQVTMTQAQSDVIRAYYDEKIALARLLRLTGNIGQQAHSQQ
ncbi:MAG: TolC family protein [Kiritimatiellae bacterium]|nr:TolC family protein [Kiritimatiellia bacterium]